jgi:hypothetical protein
MRQFYVYVTFDRGQHTERMQSADNAETACQLVLVELMAEGRCPSVVDSVLAVGV